MRVRYRHLANWSALIALLMQPAAVLGAPSASSLSGRVYGPDGATPLVGAEVLAVNLSTTDVFESDPSDGQGRYAVGALPAGYYDVAVRAEGGLFVAERPVRVTDGGAASISLSVARPNPATPVGGGTAAAAGSPNFFWSTLTAALGGPVVGTAVVVGGLVLGAAVVSTAMDSGGGSTVSAEVSPFAP